MTKLVCEHHETDDCLEHVDGEIDIEDGELQFVELHYQCEVFDLEGTYRNAGDVETTHGALVLVESRGTPIDDQRGVEQ